MVRSLFARLAAMSGSAITSCSPGIPRWLTILFPILSLCFLPYSTANGGTILEEGVFLGTHAVINPMIRIGAWSKVASGSMVYRDVPPNCLALDNPAKVRPLLRRSP